MHPELLFASVVYHTTHKLATLNLIDCITDQGGRWKWASRVGVGGDGEAVEVPIYPSDTPVNGFGLARIDLR